MGKNICLLTVFVCVILSVIHVSLSADPDECSKIIDNVNGTCCSTEGCKYITCNKTDAPANVTSACYPIKDGLEGCINTTVKNECETPTPIPTSTPTSTPVSSKCDNKTKEDCCNEDTCVYAQCEGQSDGVCVEKSKEDICEGGNYTNLSDPVDCSQYDNVNGTCCNIERCKYITCNKTDAPDNVTSACYSVDDGLEGCINTTVKNEYCHFPIRGDNSSVGCNKMPNIIGPNEEKHCETPTPIPTSTPTSTPVSSKCDNKTKEDCCNEDTCVYAQCEGQSDGVCVEKSKEDICEAGNYTNLSDPDECSKIIDNVNGTCCSTEGCKYITCNKTDAPANVTSACYPIEDGLKDCINTTVKNECETPTPIPTSTPTSTPVSSKCDNKTKEDCCNEDTCMYAQCEGQSDGVCVEKSKEDICEGGNYTDLCKTQPTVSPPALSTNASTDVNVSSSTAQPTTTPAPTCNVKEKEDCCAAANPSCQFVNCTDKDGNLHQACYSIDDPTVKDTCSDTDTNLCKPATESPSTSTPTTAAQPSTGGDGESSQHFDAASFIGGIILCAGLVAIAFFGLKFYKARTEKNYHTLH